MALCISPDKQILPTSRFLPVFPAPEQFSQNVPGQRLHHSTRSNLAPLSSPANIPAELSPLPNSWEICPPRWPLGDRLLWLLLGMAIPSITTQSAGRDSLAQTKALSRGEEADAKKINPAETPSDADVNDDFACDFDDEWAETVDDEDAYNEEDTPSATAAAGYARTAALAWIEEDWEEPEEALPEDGDYWLPDGDAWE